MFYLLWCEWNPKFILWICSNIIDLLPCFLQFQNLRYSHFHYHCLIHCHCLWLRPSFPVCPLHWRGAESFSMNNSISPEKQWTCLEAEMFGKMLDILFIKYNIFAKGVGCGMWVIKASSTKFLSRISWFIFLCYKLGLWTFFC